MRINVEDKLLADPRFDLLIQRVQKNTEYKDRQSAECFAMGCWLKACRMAQTYWCPEKKLVPVKIWEQLEFSEHILAVDLAEIRKRGVYFRGSGKYFSWFFEKCESTSIAGKARAKSAERNENGTFKSNPAIVQRPSSESSAPTPTPTPTPKRINIYSAADATPDSVIDYLNQKAGKHFNPATHRDRVTRALKWGFSIEDLKQVVDIKCSDPWFTKDRGKYLRPCTLWQSKEKIDSYLNEKSKRENLSDVVERFKAASGSHTQVDSAQ